MKRKRYYLQHRPIAGTVTAEKTTPKIYSNPDGAWRDYSKIVRGVSCFAGVVARYIGRSISAVRQQDKLERELEAMNDKDASKDLKEIKGKEVLKTRIDVVSELLENKQKQEDAMKSNEMLGAEYRDKITGFKGVCTGFCEYISGCNQALLIPCVGKDGKSPDGGWYDIQRLERAGKKIVTLDNTETPGCDMAAPIR